MSDSSADKTLIIGLLFLIIGNQLHDLTILIGASVLIAIGTTTHMIGYVEEVYVWLHRRKLQETKST